MITINMSIADSITRKFCLRWAAPIRYSSFGHVQLGQAQLEEGWNGKKERGAYLNSSIHDDGVPACCSTFFHAHTHLIDREMDIARDSCKHNLL